MSKEDSSGGSARNTRTSTFPAIMHPRRSNNAPGKINGSSGIQRRRSLQREPKRLQKNPSRRQRDLRTYGFSPGRNDIIQVPEDSHRQHPVPPLPNPHRASAIPDPSDEINAGQPVDDSVSRSRTPQAKVEGQTWDRVPTLHKRSGQELNRLKSSKKRKEEHDREAEIRAMSASMPLKRQQFRVRSDVSLPPMGSTISPKSMVEEHHTSYKIAALDILSPHPTIRYAEHPRYDRLTSADRPRKNRVSDRIKGSEFILKSHQRIDDLAEEMDASELRELMERDKRRREKKLLEDQMRMERRLARRKAKQQAEQAQAANSGVAPPKNLDRDGGVIGGGLEGSVAPDASGMERTASTLSERRRGKRPAGANEADDDGASPSEQSEGVAEITPEVPEPPTVSSTRAPSSSQYPQPMEVGLRTPSAANTPRRGSETNVRQHPSWTSFFKRTKNRKVSTDTPPSFSNTSRDSIPPRIERPAQLAPPTIVRQPSSEIPKRTKSKFREDLPELPMSPPDSRVQSPEIDVVPELHSNYPEKLPAGRGSSESPHSDPSQRRYDTPTSGLVGHRSMEAPSPEPGTVLSQSLASIGSEGSWLSGRAGGMGSKRGSLAPHPLRDSASSLQKRYREYSDSAEELGIAEDELFSRLTPGPEEGLEGQVDEGKPLDEEEEEDALSPTKWHSAAARHPRVVVNHETRIVKSREGLLQEYLENDSGQTSPQELATPHETDRKSYGFDDLMTSPPDSPEAVLGRATSMEISRAPVRQVSSASKRSQTIAE